MAPTTSNWTFTERYILTGVDICKILVHKKAYEICVMLFNLRIGITGGRFISIPYDSQDIMNLPPVIQIRRLKSIAQTSCLFMH